MGLGIPPLNIKNMLESNLLKSIMLVGRLGVVRDARSRLVWLWLTWPVWLCGAGHYGQSLHSDSGIQRVRLRQNLSVKGWNSHVHRALPGKFESTNLSRDHVSMEIGRTHGSFRIGLASTRVRF